MAVNLTWWLAVFSGERAPERAEMPRGEWEKCSRSTTIMFQVFRSWGRREELWEGKTARCGVGVRVSLPHPHLLIFLPLSYFAQHSTDSTPGIGYDYIQTASYTGVPRTRLNKLKNSALVLQIAINTETYVITSTTILKSFYSVYIHTPLKVSSSKSLSFSLSSIVFFTGWCDIHFACSFNWTPYHSSCVKKISIHIKYNNNDSYLLYTVVN